MTSAKPLSLANRALIYQFVVKSMEEKGSDHKKAFGQFSSILEKKNCRCKD